VLARTHGVDTAPFYIAGGVVYRSTLLLIREVLDAPRSGFDPESAEPAEIVRWALETHGPKTAVAFSGAEDVALIHIAAEVGLPFVALTIDTGRLHPETYAFIDEVRERYDLDLWITAPEAAEVSALVTTKGLFSFYRDGHAECCELRKVRPLTRALAGRPAWLTGQRRDQAATRGELAVVEDDRVFGLAKVNPLASWSRDQVWDFIRANDIPFNPLHARGFASIGCAPCTRPITPGQAEREGRWWWENEAAKECGLHAGNLSAKLS
jgi:phosphoadenosine phosphosulfate reductase